MTDPENEPILEGQQVSKGFRRSGGNENQGVNEPTLRRVFYTGCVLGGFAIGGYLSAMFVTVVAIMYEVTGE